jgi:uncharacterized protein YndB with AHSA1/START domain
MGGEFHEVVPNERIAFTSGALGADGAPLFEFLHVVTFEDRGKGTKLTVNSRITSAGPDAGRYIGGFEAGMTQSLERLGELLAPPTSG